MGFFDEVINAVGEFTSVKNEVTQFGSDFVKEVITEADQVKQTVTDTATEIKTTANSIEADVKDAVSTE